MKRGLLFLVVLLLTIHSYAQQLNPLGHGIRTTGTITSLVADTVNNRIYAGGYFENYGGVQVNNIAMWDGTSWNSLGSGVNGYVNSLCCINGLLYVGGSFTEAGGVPVVNIAMWDGAQWHAVGSNPITYYTVMSLANWNGELVLSAYLVAPFGPGTGIVKWDGSTWSLIASSTDANAMINLQSSNDSLIAYGRFQDLGGLPIVSAALLLPGGIINDLSISVTNAYVRTIAFYNNSIYAILNNATLRHWNSGTWVNDTLTISGNILPKLFVFRDSLYAALEGSSVYPNTIYEIWNIYNSSRYRKIETHVFPYTEDQSINVALPFKDTLYVAGSFVNFDNRQIPSSAYYDGSTWQNFGGSMLAYSDAWHNASISAFCYDTLSGNLYAGGSFQFAGDSVAYNVARWDGTQWFPMAKGFNGSVTGLVMYLDTLYACGQFTLSGSDTLKRVAKWNGSNWISVGVGANGSAYAIKVHNNQLYIGGSFSTFNGLAAKRIVKFNGATWSVVGNNVLDEVVVGIDFLNGNLIVSGSFPFGFNSPNYSAIAQLNNSTWTTLPDFPENLTDIFVFKNELYGAGYGYTTQWTSLVYKLTGGIWVDQGFLNNSNFGGVLFKLKNKLVFTSINDGMYEFDGVNSWSRLFSEGIQAFAVYEVDTTNCILGGFFPWVYIGTNQLFLNNAAEIALQKPSINYTTDNDTICEHNYIQFNASSVGLFTSYEWYFPGGSPSISTNAIEFVGYPNSGTFDVYLKEINAFGTDSILFSNAITVKNCLLSIDNPDEIKPITLFPNPSSGLLHLVTNTEFSEFSIYSLDGRLMEEGRINSSSTFNINCSHLQNGTYLIRLSDGKISRNKLFVIDHQ